jgi:hypothetical protein
MLARAPLLKAPAFSALNLKLKCDRLLSNFVFKFNLRHYTLEDPLVEANDKLIQFQLRQIKQAMAVASSLGRMLILPPILCGRAWQTLPPHHPTHFEPSFTE